MFKNVESFRFLIYKKVLKFEVFDKTAIAIDCIYIMIMVKV